MIPYLRKLRLQLVSQNNFGKYLLYAVGEILLVVIGILIAIQIDNANESKKERSREIQYLVNIQKDLGISITEMDQYIASRRKIIAAAQRIITYFEGVLITDYSAFNADGIMVYNWQKYYQSNNTFQELINSGNLAIISNDSIKNMLLNIESQYKKLKSEEDHYRFDTETTLYDPLYEVTDLKPMINNFEFRVTNGLSGKNDELKAENFDEFFKSKRLKNGFTLTILEYNTMNVQMQRLKEMSIELIDLIDRKIRE